MAKFCGKCGSKLDQDTGLCPNCDAVQLMEYIFSKQEFSHMDGDDKSSKKEAEKSRKENGREVKRGRKSIGRRVRGTFLKFILCIFILGALTAGAVSVLVYFEVIDIPAVSVFLNKVGLKPMNYDGSEDINYDNYKIEPPDAEEYFQQSSQVEEEISVNDSDKVLTEAEVIDNLEERGFDDFPITTEYTMNGDYSDAVEISGLSSEKHPIYETYYVNEKKEVWTIMVVDGDVMAIPVSYNLQLSLGVQIVISESTMVTSYDSTTNKFFKNIPDESVLIVKVVEKICAETLEELTIEVIDTL